MKKLIIERAWCKGCNICIAFCPKEVLALDHDGKVYVKNEDNCIYCGLCELRCPDLAIVVHGGKAKGKKSAGDSVGQRFSSKSVTSRA